MKSNLILLFFACFIHVGLLAQGIDRGAVLTDLNVIRFGLKQLQLTGFTGSKVQITGEYGYLSQISAGSDGQELKLMVYLGTSMRIAHNAFPNSGQNYLFKKQHGYQHAGAWLGRSQLYL